MKLTRRELLKLGAGSGLSLALGWRPRFALPDDLITKPIPSSGETVPVVGIGTRNYRGGQSSEEWPEWRATLKAFAELGGKVLDTAPAYGNSETVVGTLMSELGITDQLFIATKVGEEGREAGIESMESSFDKLRTEQIDLMQVHNLRGVDTQVATMREWKDAGRLRYIGITTSSDRQYDEMAPIMSRHELDFIQVDYSLGNRTAEERILPLAADRGMAVLINLPFGRTRLFDAVGDRPLPDWASEIGCETWAQFFLKYVVSHPAVTCAIPGTTKERHVRDNLAAARGRLPDARMRRRMEELYDSL
jgi:aryl-alcohol dehydrogenase-like predicted oxidoreductase